MYKKSDCCCVIPEGLKNHPTLKNMQIPNPLTCQFQNDLQDLYSFNGQSFCALHLPIELEEKSINKKKIFDEMLNEGKENFQFISIQDLEVKSCGKLEQLNFNGAELWSFAIRGVDLNTLDLSYCRINGINNITKIKVDYFYLKESEVSSYLKIEECKFRDVALIDRSYFYFEKNKPLRLDSANYGVHWVNSEINTFRMINSICELELNFRNIKVNILDIRDTKFYLCPAFFECDFTKKIITLPRRDDFDFSKLTNQHYSTSNFKAEKFNREKKDFYAMENQYFRLREIYNLTKNNNMYAEQSDYFFLMQFALEKTTRWNRWERFLSCCYRKLSDYGTNTLKPFCSLFLLWGISGVVYSLIKATGKILSGERFPECLFSKIMSYLFSGLFLSLQQIIKPYSLIFTKDYNSFFYILLGFVESTLSITLIALFLIGLRWNFKKT